MRSEKAELTAFHSLAMDVVTVWISWSVCGQSVVSLMMDVVTVWMSWSICERMSRDADRSL